MVVLLRDQGIPARLVQGFLPGSRDDNGTETILSSSAHAWVEVYFPGYGWQLFDPTGGGRAQNWPLVVGDPVASASPSAGPAASGLPQPSRRADGRDIGGPTGGGTSARPRGTAPGLLIAVAVLLLLAVGGLAFLAWQRGPRGEVSAEAAWRSVGRTAARFGFGPRATQTVYEYAGSLGEALPVARPALETVARAEGEVAYGRRELAPDALAALRDAQRRLRLTLLRLAFLREERRRRRGRRGL